MSEKGDSVGRTAGQPPPALPARPAKAKEEKIDRILGRLTAEQTTHQKLILEDHKQTLPHVDAAQGQ